MHFVLQARRAAARALCCAAIAMSSLASHAAPELGVYRWDAPNGPANVDGFSQWLGRPVSLATIFEANDTWANIDGAAWQLGPWSQWVRAQHGRNLSIAVPLLPASGASLANCAAGQYDVHWANLANELAYYGLHWAYLRLGWEMDGTWSSWSAAPGSGKEASFAGCFRRVVQVMRRTQPANQWKFVWNVTTINWNRAYLDAVWPGNEYVDVVAIDLYDQSWASNTYPYPSTCDPSCRLTRQQNAWAHYSWHLYTIRDFAIAHGKPMAFPEWGVAIRADGHGGGDNPYFIRKMHEFIHNPANNVAFHSYWNVSAPDIDGRLTGAAGGDNPGGSTRFPESANLFRQLFGAIAAPAPAPSPADTTPPSVFLTSPAEGTVIPRRTTFTLESTASDNVGVVGVDFFVNNQRVCRVEAAPYRCTWKSSNGNGVKSYTITATATDLAGNQASSTRTYSSGR